MSTSTSSRDRYDRGRSTIGPRSGRPWIALVFTLVLPFALITDGTNAFAQAAFDPPPPPTTPTRYAPPAANPEVVSPSSNDIAPKEPITPTPGGPQPLEGGEIVARVDGEIVLSSDVLWQVEQIIAANRDRIPPEKESEVRRMLVRQQVMGLIDTKLLYADFRRTVPAENIPTIEENIRQPFEENEIPRLIEVLEVEDQDALALLLESYGSSLATVRSQFFERTIASEWIRNRADKPRQATHEEMLDYYEEHQTDYDYPAQVKWEELAIRLDRVNGDREAAWRQMAELGNEVWQNVAKHPELRGPIFAEIAKQKSHGFNANEGGQHDWTTRGALRSEELNDALFSLELGQLSNIIETDSGFHIVRVLQRKEAGRTPFIEAQTEIRKKLEAGRRQELIQAELVKLRKEARVWTAFDGKLSGPELSELLNQRQRR